MKKLIQKINFTILSYTSFIIALAAVLGSLYFSLVLKLPPCDLCWYQRILMYPLVVIIPVGLIRNDKNLPYYVLPLTSIGTVIALYQSLLQWGIIKETIQCTGTVSCVTTQIQYFGFITIPFLSLCAFVIISVCMMISLRQSNK